MKKIKLLSLMLLLLPLAPVRADEGMWLLPLLEKMNSGRMTELGFEITPQEIYDLNNTSLKDAIVIFGNGCTGYPAAQLRRAQLSERWILGDEYR